MLAGLASAAVPGAPASAATRGVDLFYKIYIGGFHVIDLDVDIGLAPTEYDVAARVKSVGMVGRMFPWWMKAYSRGEISDSTVRPVSAGQQNNWRGKDRFIDLKFSDGVAEIDRIVPRPETDDRDRVPLEMRKGAVDLTSAIIALIRGMEAGRPCEAQVPVFDGRRRYDLVVTPDGGEKLRRSGYTPFVGDTVNCRLSIDKKAGFKKNDDSGWNDRDRSARVWMGKAFGDVPPVPVRLTLNTPLGSLVAHLNAASLEADGRKVELQPPEEPKKK